MDLGAVLLRAAALKALHLRRFAAVQREADEEGSGVSFFAGLVVGIDVGQQVDVGAVGAAAAQVIVLSQNVQVKTQKLGHIHRSGQLPGIVLRILAAAGRQPQQQARRQQQGGRPLSIPIHHVASSF